MTNTRIQLANDDHVRRFAGWWHHGCDQATESERNAALVLRWCVEFEQQGSTLGEGHRQMVLAAFAGMESDETAVGRKTLAAVKKAAERSARQRAGTLTMRDEECMTAARKQWSLNARQSARAVAIAIERTQRTGLKTESLAKLISSINPNKGKPGRRT